MSLVIERRAIAPRKPFRRIILLFIGLLTAALAVTGCQVSTVNNAITPGNRPTIVAGYYNGALPTSVLYRYSSNCSLYKAAAGSFIYMVEAARHDGVYLAPAECYRDYAGQVYWRNYWCQVGICANAAFPGYSNHGWGKAADLGDQYGSLTWNSPGYQWMVKNAGAWGWNHPGGVNEAWHWEWVGDGGTMHASPVRPDLMSVGG